MSFGSIRSAESPREPIRVDPAIFPLEHRDSETPRTERFTLRVSSLEEFLSFARYCDFVLIDKPFLNYLFSRRRVFSALSQGLSLRSIRESEEFVRRFVQAACG